MPSLDESPFLTAALGYAARGWPVVPIYIPDPAAPRGCSCGKADCPSPAKHPTPEHGLKQASTNRRQLESWAATQPHAGIAIRTGAISAMIVVDIDPRHGGIASFAALQARYGALPDTLTGRTGSGGYHYVYAYPGGNVANSVGQLAIGVDVRGDGGYIVAPPSRHISGGVYAWANDLEPAALPSAWVALLIRPVNVVSMTPRTTPGDEDGAHWLDAALLQARDGNRNDRGFWLACQLRDSGYDETGAAHFMEQYASRLGGDYTMREALHSLDQAFKAAPRDRAKSRDAGIPLYVKSAHGERVNTETGEMDDESEGSDDPEPLQEDAPNLTDLGNARRLVRDYGENLRYVTEWGWLGWNGRHWELDASGVAERYARRVVRDMYRDARILRKKQQSKTGSDLLRWAFKTESSGRLDAMVHQAQFDATIVARSSAFDTDPWLLPCANGSLDLRTGLLRESSQLDYATKASPVVYNSAAPSPTWDAFLLKVLPDADVRSFVQRYAGYTLTGSTDEQCLVFLHGAGSNGKSTLLGLIQQALGDYATQTPPETLMVKKSGGGGIPNDIAALAGKRMVTTIEVEDGKRLAESLIKSLTGQDLITARFLRREFFSFRPVFKVWLAANHKPVIRGTDHAIWRRIHLVPFSVQITDAERRGDPTFLARIKEELPGILHWCVQGCIDWQKNGLNPPATVRKATEDYQSEMDMIGPFIDECCVLQKGKETYAGPLYQSYVAWCQQNGEEAIKQRSFGGKLAEKGLERDRGSGNKHLWRGILLRADAPKTAAALTLVTEPRVKSDPSDPSDSNTLIPPRDRACKAVTDIQGHLGNLGHSDTTGEEEEF